MFRSHVMVCGGTGCTSSGSAKIMEAFEREIALNGLDKEVKVIHTGCFGLCALGPIVVVYPEGCLYSRVKEEDDDAADESDDKDTGDDGCHQSTVGFARRSAHRRAAVGRGSRAGHRVSIPLLSALREAGLLVVTAGRLLLERLLILRGERGTHSGLSCW